MGIRYLAISIDQQDYEHVRRGTCQTCGEEPRLRDLGDEADTRRETLDLDKSWHYYQQVLATEPARPAAALVDGHVTNTYWGWRSHQGLLSNSDVAAIAQDLAKVTPALVRERLFAERSPGFGPDDRAQQDVDYVCHYLPQAQEFTQRVADEGRSILYFIG